MRHIDDTRHRYVTAPLALVLCGLALAACGGSSGSATASTGHAGTGSAATASTGTSASVGKATTSTAVKLGRPAGGVAGAAVLARKCTLKNGIRTCFCPRTSAAGAPSSTAEIRCRMELLRRAHRRPQRSHSAS
jgi:hypothetical protein